MASSSKMKTRVRGKGFETNSSSQHSLCVDRSEMKDFALDPETLRSGVIKVVLPKNGYGWEWFRYYRPENKIAYMLLQLAGGYLPLDSEDVGAQEDHAPLLAARDDRTDYFLREIEAATGCKVVVTRDDEDVGSGFTIDHDSLGVGHEILGDEADIVGLVFGSGSYIETGNDNDNPPEKIETDLERSELYFPRTFVDQPRPGTDFSVTEIPGEGWEKKIRFEAEGRSVSTQDVTWEFRKQIRSLLDEDEATVTEMAVRVPHRHDLPEGHFETFARRLAWNYHFDTFRNAEGLKLLRDFPVRAARKEYDSSRRTASSDPSEFHFARQAEVSLLGKASPAAVGRIFDLMEMADDYRPNEVRRP